MSARAAPRCCVNNTFKSVECMSNVHDGVHGQDRLLMVVMSDDGNAWRMTACKQKPNMVIAMVTYPYFISNHRIMKKHDWTT